MTIPWQPLNPDEVRGIARVHHGFLYQHVAAAHALVRHILGQLDIRHLIVERDEDLELHSAARSIYLQVKAREALQFAEISRSLLRLHRLRIAHETGQRTGAYHGGFVVGGSLGPELAGRNSNHRAALLGKVRSLAAAENVDPDSLEATWTSLLWSTPGTVSVELGSIVIRESAELALLDLEADVAKIHGLADHARTSALALVTSIHAIAADSLAGSSERIVRPDHVPLLIRTITERAAELPVLPLEFVPLGLDASVLERGTATALLGISGSGKTTQLTWLALAEPNALYTRPSPNESEAIDAQVVGQLVAALAATSAAPVHLGPRQRVEVIAPLLADRLIVVDNCHLLPLSDILEYLFAAALAVGSRILLAGQPLHSDGQPTARSIRRLFAHAPRLIDVPPWTTANVTRYLARRGRPADPIAADTLRNVAAGHPLSVADIVDLSDATFDGDIEEAARSVRRGDTQSTLRAVTAAHFRLLSDHARRVAAVIATLHVSVDDADLCQFLPPEIVQAGVRELRELRYALTDLGSTSRRLRLLEAYTPEAALAFYSLFSIDEQRAIHKLAVILVEGRRRRKTSPFLVPPLLIHRAYAGHVPEVVNDLTTDGPLSTESLARTGVGTPLADALDEILKVATAPKDRFFVLDAILYLNEQEDLRRNSDDLIARMRREFEAIPSPNSYMRLVFEQKAMRINGLKNLDAARSQLDDTLPFLTDELSRAVFLSEFANVLFHHRRYIESLEILQTNVHIYLGRARVDATGFWNLESTEIGEALHTRISHDEMSRLADTIEAAAMNLDLLGDDPRQLYEFAITLHALLGQTKAAHKAIFMFLRQLIRDPLERKDAVEELEAVLTEARENGDIGKTIPFSTLIASAFEHQGDNEAAKRTLTTLADYDSTEVHSELELHRSILRIPRRSAANSAMTYLFMFGHALQPMNT